MINDRFVLLVFCSIGVGILMALPITAIVIGREGRRVRKRSSAIVFFFVRGHLSSRLPLSTLHSHLSHRPRIVWNCENGKQSPAEVLQERRGRRGELRTKKEAGNRGN